MIVDRNIQRIYTLYISTGVDNGYLGILYSYGIAVNHERDTLKTMNSSYRNTTTLTSLLLPCWLQ